MMDESPYRVDICGIPHTVEYCDDKFDLDLHLGDIRYGEAKIRINRNASASIQNEALCHEIVHGILVHIGRQDLNEEQFVQSLANAISQSFIVNLKREEPKQ